MKIEKSFWLHKNSTSDKETLNLTVHKSTRDYFALTDKVELS